jgi:phosphoribosylanthranilate isomerase
VFVNADFDFILNTVDDYGLYAVQLHGDETDEFCLDLMAKVKVIKAIRVRDEKSIAEGVTSFEMACDYFLFDTQTEQYGGSGQPFNWNWLLQVPITKPFFLSGGIGPDDLEKIKAFHHRQLHALDINSRFETVPGIKDLEKVEAFHSQLTHQ